MSVQIMSKASSFKGLWKKEGGTDKESRFSLQAIRKGGSRKEPHRESDKAVLKIIEGGQCLQEINNQITGMSQGQSPAQEQHETPPNQTETEKNMDIETSVQDIPNTMLEMAPEKPNIPNGRYSIKAGFNKLKGSLKIHKKTSKSTKPTDKGSGGESEKSPRRLTFDVDVKEDDGHGKPVAKRRDSAWEYEGDDEGFCIDGFQDEENEEEDFTDAEEDETLSEGDQSDVDAIDGAVLSISSSTPEHQIQPRMVDESKSVPKYQRIAQEIMTTEDTYVNRLSLIQSCSNKFQETCVLTKEQCEQIFKNLSEIYSFHKDKFLPRLKERIDKWEHEPRIGDVMKSFSPFLIHYTPFVKNIDNSRKLIHQHQKSSPRFSTALLDIESSSEAGRIKLSDYMTEPMTRLLRYKLLLSEYLRKLPEGHMDREDTEAALDITSEAAQHVNESIRAEDNMARLVQIQESLADDITLVEPSCIYIKDGRLAMVDPAKGRHLERHIFLFNNLLLVCQPQIMGMKYKILIKIPMKRITIENEDDHHFVVLSRKIVAEFYGSTSRETGEWVKAISEAIEKFSKENPSEEPLLNMPMEEELGHRAPRLVRRESSQTCNLCGLQFVSIRRTKNHCHACGQLYCQRCSGHTVRLAYKDWQHKRVCDRCYGALWDDAVCKSLENLSEADWVWPNPTKTKSKRGLISSSRRSLPLETREN